MPDTDTPPSDPTRDLIRDAVRDGILSAFERRNPELEVLMVRAAETAADSLELYIASGMARRPVEMIQAVKVGTDTLFRWTVVTLVQLLLFNQFIIAAVLHGQHLASWATADLLNKSTGLFTLGFLASVLFMLRELWRFGGAADRLRALLRPPPGGAP